MEIDAADMVSAVFEAGKRRSLEADLVGGFLFSAAGVASARGALRMSR